MQDQTTVRFRVIFPKSRLTDVREYQARLRLSLHRLHHQHARMWQSQNLATDRAFDHKLGCISIRTTLVKIVCKNLPLDVRSAQKCGEILPQWCVDRDWKHRDSGIGRDLRDPQSDAAFDTWRERLSGIEIDVGHGIDHHLEIGESRAMGIDSRDVGDGFGMHFQIDSKARFSNGKLCKSEIGM